MDDYIFRNINKKKVLGLFVVDYYCDERLYYRKNQFMAQILRCYGGEIKLSEDGELVYFFQSLSNSQSIATFLFNHQSFDAKLFNLNVQESKRILDNIRKSDDNVHNQLINKNDVEEFNIEETLVEKAPILERGWSFKYKRIAIILGIWNLVQLFIFQYLMTYYLHGRDGLISSSSSILPSRILCSLSFLHSSI